MTRPRLLDLFCGAGGCSVGYHRAGFDIVGVDNRPQPRYPYEFVQADALTFPLDGYDVVHASPPCHEHSALASFRNGHGTGWMLPAIRQRLRDWGGPYVIENVAGADMPGALILCGASFGLRSGAYVLRRHRKFESNLFLMASGCACSSRILGVYGNGGGRKTRSPTRGPNGYTANAQERRELMGIDWMTRAELSQAIPPAYTEAIGEQLIAALAAAA